MTHSTEVATRSAEEPAQATEKACSRCSKTLPRHYVRALNATYHLDCFTCLVCGQVVANKFFPITSPNGETFALCEKDYYRQLDLLCYRCDQPLQHSYISADDKKYHLDHFTCSMCPTVFGPEDVYYEEDGNVFCGKHYAQIASIKCVGCQLGILRQYIEITTDTVAEPWHPECYMIYKFWHVRIAPQVYTPTSRHESIGSVTNLDKDQIVDRAPPSLSNITEDIIYSIWTILSTFEESSAACISDMLIHVSKGVYVEALHVAEKFIMHVHTIFTAIDDLEDQLAQFDDATGLQHTKEPKILCKRIIRFFALLSNSEDITSSKGIEMTEELLSLVTGLAHYLKMLIRAALMGALKAEREYGSKISLNGLLHKLAEINDRDTAVAFQLSYRDIGVSSDLCALCQVTLEEECISYKSRRWHKACFNCDGCGRTLKHLYQKAAYDEAGHRVLCSTCTPQVPVPPTVRPFAFVTQLEQYSFLLRVALKRLYNLLNRKNGRLSATLLSPKAPSKAIESPAAGMTRVHPGDTAAHAPPPAKAPRGEDQKTIDMDVEHVMPPSPTVIRPPSTADVMAAAAPPEDMGITERPKDPPAPATAQSDLKRKPTLERHYVQADAVALVMVDQDAAGPPVPPKEGLLPRASSAARLPEEALRETQFYRPTIVDPPLSWEKPRDHRSRTMQPRSRTEGSLPLGSAANSTGSTPGGTQPPTPEAVVNRSDPQLGASYSPVPRPVPTLITQPDASGGGRAGATKTLLCELNLLEHFLAKHVAVLQLIPLVQNYVQADELLSMVGSRKQSIWTRLKANMNQKKKPAGKAKDVVFGSTMEELVERQGIESQHATVSTVVRVPLFFELVMDALKPKNLAVEGIFRKNGNIRRLKELSDAIDHDIHSVDLSVETAVQCAALLKKFLRELAEPLLTFRLHRLFLACERIQDETDQRRAFHLACVLLPAPNRDCAEVLFGLLRFAARFAHISADEGSRMDLGNLSTVITPNILYSNSKDPLKDDSFAAIQAVYNLLQHQDTYWTVPADIAHVLQQERIVDDNIGALNSKDILKRVEHVVRSIKKPHPGAEYAESNPSSAKHAAASRPPGLVGKG